MKIQLSHLLLRPEIPFYNQRPAPDFAYRRTHHQRGQDGGRRSESSVPEEEVHTQPCVYRTGDMLTRCRYTGETFKLKVGADVGTVEEFSVHEVVLKETSGFFKAAVKNEWKEGSQRVIDMPEDTPEVVSAYVDWLYSDKMLPSAGEPPKDVKTHVRESNYLAKLYVFGEKIQDDSFCDAVITAFTKHLDHKIIGSRHTVGVDAVETMMAGTPQGSPGRRFILQVIARRVGSKRLRKHSKSLEAIPGLLIDLVAELIDARNPGTKSADLYPERAQWFKKK